MELVPSGQANGTVLVGNTLSGATIVSSTLTGAIIFASSITGSTIAASTILSSTLSGSTMIGGTLSGVTIVASTISGVSTRATTAEIAAETTGDLHISADRAIYQQGIAKVWAVWTVTGGTVTLRDSYNVTSISDNGAGDFSVNFSTEFPTAYYSVGLAARGLVLNGGEDVGIHPSSAPTTGVCRVATWSGNGNLADMPYVTAQFWGDRT